MIKTLAEWLKPVLNIPMVRRTRRNHGLEHATIHLLSKRIKGLKMAGRSTDGGFILIGEAPTEEVERAVRDALAQMNAGARNLAVHPNCGTNLVTTGFMATLASAVTLRRPLNMNRFSAAMVFTILAIVVSQPVGMELQKHITTDGEMGDLDLVHVKRSKMSIPFTGQEVTTHQVITRRG